MTTNHARIVKRAALGHWIAAGHDPEGFDAYWRKHWPDLAAQEEPDEAAAQRNRETFLSWLGSP